MPFEKGNNLGGRTIGSKNKVSQEIREQFLKLLKDNLQKFQDDLNELEAKDRLKILLDIASYCTPKLKAVELEEVKENEDPLTKEEAKLILEVLNERY